MANDINGGLRNVLPGNIDQWNRVYATIADANAAIPSTVVEGRNFREGKTVQIGTVTDHKEHRWIGGFEDIHLKPFIANLIPSKNLINKDKIVEKVSVGNDGEIVTNSSAALYSSIRIENPPPGEYKYIGTMQNSIYARVRLEMPNGIVSVVIPPASGMPFTFSIPTGCLAVMLNTKAGGTSDYNSLQLAKVSDGDEYESFGQKIDPNYISTKLLANYLSKTVADLLYAKPTVASKNLIDKSKITPGRAINTSGDITSSGASNWALFQPIPVEIKPYTFQGAIPAIDVRIRFEDANNVKIDFIQAVSLPITFTPPAGTKYVVIPAYNSSNLTTRQTCLDTAQLEVGSTATSYVSFGSKLDSKLIDTSFLDPYIKTSVANTAFLRAKQVSKNILDDYRTNIIEPQATNTSGNFQALAGWGNFAPVPVSGGATYTFTSDMPAVDIRVRYEDINHVKIGFLPTATAKPVVFTVPDNCAFIVVPAYHTTDTTLRQAQINSGFLMLGSVDARLLPEQKPVSWLVGKKIVFLGDSITAQDRYTKLVAAVLGSTYDKNGVSGACIATGKENVEPDGIVRLSFYERSDSIAALTPDFIFIFGGTNDWYYNVPIGVLSDNATNTFYGGLKGTIVKLQAQNPGKRIAVSNMLQRTNSRSNYISQKTYADATLEVCRAYGVPCFDAFGKSGITYENIGQYTTDNVHPKSPEGDTLIARQFASFINSL